MAKKISNKDIFEDGLFSPAVKNAEALNKELDKLEQGLKDIATVAKKDLKNIKVVNFSDVQKGTKAIKEVDAAFKGLTAVEKERIKLREKLKQQNSTAINQNTTLKRQVSEQIKVNKDLEIIQNKNAGTLQKLAAQNRILRRERERLNLDTEKGRKRLKEINTELDKNNKRITDNSDKLKKQRMNVGNYTDSIKEAAGASGLFGGVLGKLNQIQGVLNALTKKNTVQEEVNTVAKEANAAATLQLSVAQRSLSAATALGTKALKAFKIALASTGIGLLLIAIGGLVAFFKRSQDGADALSKGLAGLQAGIDVLIDRFEKIGRGLVLIFSGLGDELKKAQIKLKIFILEAAQFKVGNKVFNDSTKEVAKLNKELDGLGGVSEGLDLISEAFKNIGDEIANDVVEAAKLKDLTKELTREQKLFEAEQATTLTRTKELNLIAKDKLKTDEERIASLKEANKLEIGLAQKQLALQERSLAASLDAISSDERSLSLDADRLEFIEQIKNGQISAADAVQKAADFTLSSAAGEEALFEIIEKIVAQEQAKQFLYDKQATTIKKTSALQVQVATKNSKALLQESKFRKEIAKDEDEAINNRIDALEEARDFEIDAAKVRRDANIINEREYQALRLTVTKSTQEAIQKLLEKTDNLTDKNREKIIKKQIETINKIEQEQFKGEIDRIDRLAEAEELSNERRIELINESNELRRSQLEAQAEFELSQAGLTAEQINELRETGSTERLELEEGTAEEVELVNIQLQNDLANLEDDRLKSVEDVNSKIEDSDKKSAEKRLETANKLIDLTSEAFSEAFDEREKALDDEIKRREEKVSLQQSRAEQGLENQLAFEKEQLAKAELERARLAEKRAKQEEAAALAQAFLNAFAARSKDNPDTAAAKALTDVIIAKALAETVAGAFAEGVEDFQGKGTGTSDSNLIRFSHGESVVTAKGTKENQGLVTAMNNGEVGSWFANNMMLSPLSSEKNYDSFGILANEIKEIKQAIKNRPTSQTNLDNMGNVLQSTYRNGIKNTVKYLNKPGVI